PGQRGCSRPLRDARIRRSPVGTRRPRARAVRSSAKRGPLAALAALVVAVAVGTPLPASAGTPPATTASTSAEPRITLEAQDAWAPVGGAVTFRFDIANAPPGATLNLTAYQPLITRSDFDAIAQGGTPRGALAGGSLSAPVEELAVDPDTGWRVVTI